MKLRDFFSPNRTKLLISLALFFISLILSLIIGNLYGKTSTGLLFGALIFFPIFFYTYFHFLLTKPVADFNNCIFPGCNLVVNILTLITSIAIYYALGALIYHFWWGKRSKKQKI